MQAILGTQRSSSLSNPPPWLLSALFGPRTYTGRNVSVANSLTLVPVFACIRILSQALGALPLLMYKHQENGGKLRDSAHPLYSLLHDLTNPFMTAIEFRETFWSHVFSWGNGYAEIQYNGAGRPIALWPLRPDRMKVHLINNPSEPSADGVVQQPRLSYEYQIPNGEVVFLDPSVVMHVRLFGHDGVLGYSPTALGREAIGLGLATEEYGSKWFGNGSRPSGVLTHPGKLMPDSAVRLKASWEAFHQGLDNAQRVAVLEEGMDFKAIGIPPEDAQFLQTRQFQLEEIARLFGVPLHRLGATGAIARGTVEQESIEFVTYTLVPHCERLEQAIHRDLLLPSERGVWFAEHLIDGLLRGALLDRYQAYAMGRQNGWLSVNDIRSKENLNPIAADDGGDELLAAMNMVPLASLMTSTTPATTKNPSPTAGSGPNPQVASVRRLELRAGGAASRQRIATSYHGLFEDAANRILTREQDRVMGQAGKQLRQQRDQQMVMWLETYYRDHAEYVTKQLLPVFSSLADAVNANAAEQIGIPANSDDLARFTRGLADVAGLDWADSSLGQLREVLKDATTAGADPIAALLARFAEWNDKRPSKLAELQSIRATNAVAKETFQRGGITKLRWEASGKHDCAYCSHLNGKVVGIEHNFVGAGDSVHPHGVDAPLKPSRNIGHPPLHESCHCMIEPEG